MSEVEKTERELSGQKFSLQSKVYIFGEAGEIGDASNYFQMLLITQPFFDVLKSFGFFSTKIGTSTEITSISRQHFRCILGG